MTPEEYDIWKKVYETFKDVEGASPSSGGSIGVCYDWEDYGLAATIVVMTFSCDELHVLQLTALAIGAGIQGKRYPTTKCIKCQAILDKLKALVPVITEDEIHRREYVREMHIAAQRLTQSVASALLEACGEEQITLLLVDGEKIEPPSFSTLSDSDESLLVKMVRWGDLPEVWAWTENSVVFLDEREEGNTFTVIPRHPPGERQ